MEKSRSCEISAIFDVKSLEHSTFFLAHVKNKNLAEEDLKLGCNLLVAKTRAWPNEVTGVSICNSEFLALVPKIFPFALSRGL